MQRVTEAVEHPRAPARRAEREKAHAARADMDAAPIPTAVLALQRAAGNRAARRAATAALTRKPKAKPKPKPKPAAIECTVDAKGAISVGGVVVGFRDAGGTSYATPGGVDPAQSTLGALVPRTGSETTLVKMVKVTVSGGPGGATMTPTKQEVGVVAGKSGFDGVLVRGEEPVAPADAPASVKSVLVAGARVRFANGRVWTLMKLPTGGLGWVMSRETRAGFTSRRKAIADEIAKLPEPLRTQIGAETDLISLVSLLEGLWGSTTGPGYQATCRHGNAKKPHWRGPKRDRPAEADADADAHNKENAGHGARTETVGDIMASIGIFQWGVPKFKAGKGGSLADFYASLKRKHAAASAKPPDKRTDEDRLYIAAWQQCTAAKLDVSGGKITIDGKEVTGAEVELAMGSAMATGALKTYQLVAAHEWLADVRGKSIFPGEWAKPWLGNGYTGGPSSAVFDTPRYRIELEAPSPAPTVGQACTSEKMFAAVANLLPNRPAYVPPCLWRALVQGDPKTLAKGLIDTIVAAQDAAAAKAAAPATPATPALHPKAKGGKKKAPPKPVITLATAADKDAMGKLQRLVWPDPTGVDQARLLADFYAAALELYKREDDKAGGKNKWDVRVRARRLATTEAVY
jgi:hypothetical protein